MPEGTTPASAARQQAAGPASRGLKLGNIVIPWWGVGLGAVTVGLIGFLVYRNMRSQGPPASTANAGSSAGTPTSPGVTSQAVPTAATLVPLPYPTPSSTTGQTATQSSGLGSVTLGPSYPGSTNAWTFSGPSISGPKTILPFGTYQMAGAPIGGINWGGQPTDLWPIVGPGGNELYALGVNVENYNPSASSLNLTQLQPSAA